jgi:hypothetical protein
MAIKIRITIVTSEGPLLYQEFKTIDDVVSWLMRFKALLKKEV